MAADHLAGRKYALFPPHASRNLVTFSSHPKALEKGLEMWQDFGLCVRNVPLACEKPPSKFFQVISPQRDKSSLSQALTKAGQLKKNPPKLYSSLTAPCKPPEVCTQAPLRETQCRSPGVEACWGVTRDEGPTTSSLSSARR